MTHSLCCDANSCVCHVAQDDNIEATYEARPWRQYIIEAASGKIIAVLGLAPFNMDGKLAVIKSACAGWKK